MQMLPRALPAALLSLTMLAPAAMAQRSAPPPPPPDQVVLQLESEAWVDTETAKLVASVETVLSGEQAAQPDGRVPPVLEELAKGDWRVTMSHRSRAASGTARWRVPAAIRAPDRALRGHYAQGAPMRKPGPQPARGGKSVGQG